VLISGQFRYSPVLKVVFHIKQQALHRTLEAGHRALAQLLCGVAKVIAGQGGLSRQNGLARGRRGFHAPRAPKEDATPGRMASGSSLLLLRNCQ